MLHTKRCNLATRGVNDVDAVGVFIDCVLRVLPELHERLSFILAEHCMLGL